MDALLEQHEELRKLKESGKNIEHVDNIINLLTQARDAIAAGGFNLRQIRRSG